MDSWRDIKMDPPPKDGTPILLKLKNPIPNERGDLRVWDGVRFVGKHEGPGTELWGWHFAAPVGQGGFPDEWFEGWRLLPDDR